MTNRWMLTLACTHKLLADDAADIGDLDFCPACGESYPVMECYAYQDGDV